MRIAVGSDHRGFATKTRLMALLQDQGHEVADCGTHSDHSCDYPDVAVAVCGKLASQEVDRCVLLCGSGIGMTMAANKMPGVRAALCHDELTAEMSRRHNDANVLCLPADLLGEELMRRMVDVWLSTPFESGRHARRLQKIAELERRYMGGPAPALAMPPQPPSDAAGTQPAAS